MKISSIILYIPIIAVFLLIFIASIALAGMGLMFVGVIFYSFLSLGAISNLLDIISEEKRETGAAQPLFSYVWLFICGFGLYAPLSLGVTAADMFKELTESTIGMDFTAVPWNIVMLHYTVLGLIPRVFGAYHGHTLAE